MVTERILRNRRIENAKKHLYDEWYLKSMEEYITAFKSKK